MIGTECDVYAPCAVGGTITAETVEQLRCSVVAGAANNQLAAPALADRLHERGILYAPDYVINSGGVLHGTGLELLGWDQPQLDEALRGLGDTLHELYADDGRSPVHAAEALVASAAARARASGAAAASSTPRSRSQAAIGPPRSRIASSTRASVREVAEVADEVAAEAHGHASSSVVAREPRDHGLAQLARGAARAREHAQRDAVALAQQAEQHVPRLDRVVAEPHRLVRAPARAPPARPR